MVPDSLSDCLFMEVELLLQQFNRPATAQLGWRKPLAPERSSRGAPRARRSSAAIEWATRLEITDSSTTINAAAAILARPFGTHSMTLRTHVETLAGSIG